MARVTCALQTDANPTEFIYIKLDVEAKDLREAAQIMTDNWPKRIELPDVGPLKNIVIESDTKDEAGFEYDDLRCNDIPDEYEEEEEEEEEEDEDECDDDDE